MNKEEKKIKKIISEQIPKRVRAIRAFTNTSQRELATYIGIDYKTYNNIETLRVKRGFSLEQLIKIAKRLNVSISALFEVTAKVNESIFLQKEAKEINGKKQPCFDYQRFCNVLLYLIPYASVNPLLFKESIVHLLYLADCFYYQKHELHLSTLSYRKSKGLPKPVGVGESEQESKPIEFVGILDKMKRNLLIKEVKVRVPILPNSQSKATISSIKLYPTKSANLAFLKASEVAMVNQVITNYGSWSYLALREYLKKDIVLLNCKEQELIDYSDVSKRKVSHLDKEQTGLYYQNIGTIIS